MSLWHRLWGGPSRCEDTRLEETGLEVKKQPSLRPLSSRNNVTMTEEDSRAAAARAAELQAALTQERQRVGQKDQELQAASQLVAKLEQDLEFQQKPQERIATLEEAVSQRQNGEDVTVEKLLLAVAGEKQFAEERAEKLERDQSQLAESRRQREEEQARRQGEERWKAEREKRLSEAQAKLADGERARTELQQNLLREQEQLADVLQKLADLRPQRAQDGGLPASGQSRDISDLERQIHEELTGRQQVQRYIIENMQNLFALEQQLAQERGASAQGPALSQGWSTPGHPAHPAEALPWSPGRMSSPARPGVTTQLWQAVPGGTAGTPGVATWDSGRDSPQRGHQAPPAQYMMVSTGAGNVRYQQVQPGMRQGSRLATPDVQSRLDRMSTTFS